VRSTALSLSPGCGSEKQEDGEYLQSAEKHIQSEKKLGCGGEECEIAHGAYIAESGTDVIETGDDGGEAALHVDALQNGDEQEGNK
jgi:hypothetical protein